MGTTFADVLSVVGAGGKSSLLQRIAFEAGEHDAAVILTTTTRLAATQMAMADNAFLYPAEIPEHIQGTCLVFSGQAGLDSNSSIPKLAGLAPGQVMDLRMQFPEIPVVIEADGAAGAELKFPGKHEPVIPYCTNTVVAVTSCNALGKRLTDIGIHRRECLEQVFPDNMFCDLTPEAMAFLLDHADGAFRHTGAAMKKVWLLNKADSAEDVSLTCEFAEQVAAIHPDIDSILVGSLKTGVLYVLEMKRDYV